MNKIYGYDKNKGYIIVGEGGAGSGNFGHKGRPGLRGGSSGKNKSSRGGGSFNGKKDDVLTKSDERVISSLMKYAELKGDFDEEGGLQCHESVQNIKTFAKSLDKDIKKNLTYYEWDESKWDSIGKKLKKDNKKFDDKNINNLVEGIVDGSINGHSFIKYKNTFIDPNLKSLGTSQKDIDSFDEYMSSLIKGKKK